jgi:hypothetical protein
LCAIEAVSVDVYSSDLNALQLAEEFDSEGYRLSLHEQYRLKDEGRKMLKREAWAGAKARCASVDISYKSMGNGRINL